jgi:hypothetical protein
MSTVVDFKRPHRQKPEDGWSSGEAVCIACKKRWVAVAPVGVRWLECPSCGANKGIFSNPFGAQEGDSVFICNHCGGEALTAYYHDNLFYLRCMGCGVDHTAAIFGE